jgi:hypothetical protein
MVRAVLLLAFSRQQRLEGASVSAMWKQLIAIDQIDEPIGFLRSAWMT